MLAERLGVHISNATGILDRLAEAGLVCRQEDATDRRLVLCRLTAQGEATLTRLYNGRAEQIGERVDLLTPKNLAALHTGLTALLAHW